MYDRQDRKFMLSGIKKFPVTREPLRRTFGRSPRIDPEQLLVSNINGGG